MSDENKKELEQNAPPVPDNKKEEKSVSEVVFDKKGAARLKALEEKNQSVEEKLGILLANKQANDTEIEQLKTIFASKTPEQKKSFMAELNEFVESLYK